MDRPELGQESHEERAGGGCYDLDGIPNGHRDVRISCGRPEDTEGDQADRGRDVSVHVVSAGVCVAGANDGGEGWSVAAAEEVPSEDEMAADRSERRYHDDQDDVVDEERREGHCDIGRARGESSSWSE